MCLLATSSICIDAAGKKKVHTIGDSTMANYATDGSTDKRGWSQMLQQFFDVDNIVVNNRGKSGASSKSFYKESAYWPTMVKGGSDEMQKGDFLIIQFAHNDEKSNGTDGDEENALGGTQVDYRGTTPFGTFKEYLRKYIDEAKAMGVKPILCGAICRKYFSGNTIRRNGRHDLGDSFNKIVDGKVTTGNKIAADDHTMDYVWQMQQVAAEYDDVPFIDLTTITADLYVSYGEAYCTTNLFCKDDSTHPAALGATLIARAFAQQLKTQAENEKDEKKKAILQELAADVIVSNEISFNPVSGDMGETYIGMNVTKEYNVSAFGLAAETGIFTFKTSEGFEVSLDKKNWSNNVEVSYSGSSLISTIYVRAKVTEAGKKNGTLTASDGTNTKTLDLSVSGINLAGGEETSCVWELNGNGSAATSQMLTGSDVTLSEMVMQGNTVTPTAGSTMGKMAYFNIDGSTWPAGEIDEVSTRYIQFQATVPAGKEFNLDKISFNVCGWGGNSVCFHAYYATKADFSDQVLIAEQLKMTNKSSVAISADAVKKLGEGESVFIRIYPWLSTSSPATGKYIALSDVTIHGMISEAGGEVITIEGAEINNPFVDGKTDEFTYSKQEMELCMTTPTISFGKNVAYSKTRNMGGYVANLVINKSGASLSTSASDDNAVIITYRPADGFTFMPSNVSFGASRVGTSGGNLAVDARVGDKTETLKDTWAPGSYQTDPYYNNFSESVDGLAATTENPLVLRISLLGLGNNKEIAFHDIKVTGTLTGTMSKATRYPLNVLVTPEEAGVVTLTPKMDDYKEGSTVSLSAKKNFGYKFKEWQDGTGAVVSTDAETTITMDSEKTMTAVFEAIPVYTVATSCTNDADRPLGSVTLTPDEHAGKYEAGTEITVVANESKILKFMQWTDEFENAGTSATRKLTVNSDMTLVANYEVQDFIAVFDDSTVGDTYAYETTATYPFNADLTWDDARNAKASIVSVADGKLLYTQNGGTPVVRNRNGVVIAAISGLYQNGYATDDIAWQYQFSTKGFTSATIVADMAAKNAATKQWKAQYSVDGKNFADIAGAEWEATANVVNPVNVTLPADAIGQELVYVRFTGVKGSDTFNTSYAFDKQFNGMKYCDHSEAGFGNMYVLGEAEVGADEDAPVVTSTIPANNATGVSASGTITISYNERIQSGNLVGAKATLNGEEMAATWNSRSVSFPYFALEYGKTYTFTMPYGYVEDKSGNKAEAVELTFTVMERQKPQARTFNAIVDGSLSEEKIAATADMPVQYKTIQAAINDAPDTNEKPYLIYIKEGYYKDSNKTFADSYGQIKMNASDAAATQIPGGISQYDPNCYIINVNKPNIHLIGQDVNKVTIATDRLDGMYGDGTQRPWYHINAGATLEVQAKGTDFFMENVTLDNENWTKLKMAGPQALSANVSADRAVFNNCNIRSYQDTYYNGGDFNRTFINNTTIEGAVDFIYGSSDIWFEGCTLNINRKEGGYIVAPNHSNAVRWGYVFNNTKITTNYVGDPSTYKIYFGRPWHNAPKTVFLHTQMELTPYDGYWYPTMGGIPSLWAVYDIWDRNGNKLSETSISKYYYGKKEDGTYVEGIAKNSLTAEEVQEYTLNNVMAGDKTSASTGYWNPLPIVEKTAKPVLAQNGGVVTWNADDYAICYVVTVNGKPVAFPTEASYAAKNGDVITVQSVNEYGALSEMSESIIVDTTVDGITDIHSGEKLNGKGRYNLSGQRVENAPQHGVFIENGKKFVK